MSKESKIILSIMALVIAGAVAMIMYVNNSGGGGEAVVSERLIREDSHRLGEGTVELVEFGDYQCPACAQAHPVTKQLVEDLDGRVAFIFRHFPLPQIHSNALAAAEAAEAAGAQGKFWEMHNRIFENQNQWSVLPDPTDVFVDYATDLDLDVDTFREDLTQKANSETISGDQSDGYAVGVSGTPTFFVNGKRQSRTDYDSLKNAIEAEL